jgi:hypothetical protein
VLLCAIFWDLGSINLRAEQVKSDSHVSIDLQDFDEDAEL